MAGAGVLIGSLIQDSIHITYHFGPDLTGIIPGYGLMKAAHMRHHFRDCSKEFGVITSMWDYPLGTKYYNKQD